jgi:hypothetical protein
MRFHVMILTLSCFFAQILVADEPPALPVPANDLKQKGADTAKGNQEPTDSDSSTKQQQALFQKLRTEGWKVELKASILLKNDLDAEIRELQNYVKMVSDSALEPQKQTSLTRPFKARIEQYRVMRKQIEFLKTENEAVPAFDEESRQEALSKQKKKTEIAKLMPQFLELFEAEKFREAENLAVKMRELDPDDPLTQVAVTFSKSANRSLRWEAIQERARSPFCGKPLAELPKHIIAPAGQLTMFADFDNPQDNRVPMYLVNRTAKPIPMNSQDWDVYMKLEYESAPGVWTRAESHEYSMCGNSYFTKELRPDWFLPISGYHPKKGEKAKVRYRLHEQQIAAASNISEGLIDKTEVEKAAADEMTIQHGDFEFLCNVALGKVKNLSHRREDALWRLLDKKFDVQKVMPILEQLANDPDQELASLASRNLESRRKSPAPKQ